MPKLEIVKKSHADNQEYCLVYGLRIFPKGEVFSVEHGRVQKKDGKESNVTMHLLEGSREKIRARLIESIDAFFEIQADRAAD